MMLSLALAMVIQGADPTIPVQVEADRQPRVHTGGDCLIQGGKVFTITGKVWPSADVLIRGGKIVQIAEFASAGELITKKVDMGGLHPKQLAIYVASRGTDASTGRKIMVCLNA